MTMYIVSYTNPKTNWRGSYKTNDPDDLIRYLIGLGMIDVIASEVL